MNRKWTKEEEEIISRVYMEKGQAGLKELEIDRTHISMLSKIARLGVTRQVDSKWTKEEVDVLRAFYNKEGVKGCQERGLQKTFSEVYNKANYMNLRRINSSWTDEEINLLKEVYPKEGVKGCMERGLSRSGCSIKNKAQVLGIKMKPDYRTTLKNYWTNEEINILKEVYPKEGVKGCQKRGIVRTTCAIKYKARLIGIKVDRQTCNIEQLKPSWTLKEIELLKKYYILGGSKLCKSKGILKNNKQIQRKANVLGLRVRK